MSKITFVGLYALITASEAANGPPVIYIYIYIYLYLYLYIYTYIYIDIYR